MNIEPILDPERPICDPHHHLWDLTATVAPSAGEAQPRARYLLEELTADLQAGHNIVSTVSVECQNFYLRDGPKWLRPAGETQEIMRLTSGNDKANPVAIAAAIVGHADLTAGDEISRLMEAHIDAGKGRFRGIRQMAAADATGSAPAAFLTAPGLLMSTAFRRGFARLGDHGLVFDAWVFHPQLGEVADLAAAFPDQPIILDHMGSPLRIGAYASGDAELFDHWRARIRTLARLPNISIKLGGLGMPLCGFPIVAFSTPSDGLADLWRPWMETAIEAFGVDRAMFESNFPVDGAVTDYRTLWNAFKLIADAYSDDEKDALFRSTAQRAYGIKIACVTENLREGLEHHARGIEKPEDVKRILHLPTGSIADLGTP